MNVRLLTTMVLAFLLTLTSQPAESRAPVSSEWEGTGSGVGGGEILTEEVRDVLWRTIFDLEELTSGKLLDRQLNTRALIDDIGSIDIEMTAPGVGLSIDGRRKDAVNYPDLNKIIFDREVWMQLSYNHKQRLALHELIGLKLRGEVDDSDYRYSREAVSLLSANMNWDAIDLTQIVHVQDLESIEWVTLKLIYERLPGRTNSIRAHLIYDRRVITLAATFATVPTAELKWVASDSSLAAGYWVDINGVRVNSTAAREPIGVQIKVSDATGVPLEIPMFNYPCHSNECVKEE